LQQPRSGAMATSTGGVSPVAKGGGQIWGGASMVEPTVRRKKNGVEGAGAIKSQEQNPRYIICGARRDHHPKSGLHALEGEVVARPKSKKNHADPKTRGKN